MDSYQDSFMLQARISALENELANIRNKQKQLLFPNLTIDDFPAVKDIWESDPVSVSFCVRAMVSVPAPAPAPSTNADGQTSVPSPVLAQVLVQQMGHGQLSKA